MPSKNTLSFLPSNESLMMISQSLAMLDAILSPEWEYRYYSFNSKWGKSEMMASMRNGEGDEYFILFNAEGAIIKGFAHESPMSPYANESKKVWQGVLDDVPDPFKGLLADSTFSIEDTTFCIWRRYVDLSWQTGNIDYPDSEDSDGSKELLFILDGKASTYKEFAEEYYETEIDTSSIEHIYQHKPLTKEIVASINEQVTLKELIEDIAEIGYPNK